MKNISTDMMMMGFVVLAITFTVGHYWGSINQ